MHLNNIKAGYTLPCVNGPFDAVTVVVLLSVGSSVATGSRSDATLLDHLSLSSTIYNRHDIS